MAEEEAVHPAAAELPPPPPPPPGWDVGLTSIDVTTNKTEYFVGEQIVVTVTGIYDGDIENTINITEYVEITGNDPSTAGSKTITARTGSFEESTTVLVKQAKVISLAVTKAPDKTVYYSDSDTAITLNGIEVVGTLDNASTINISIGSLQVVSGYNLTTAGQKNITIKYINTDSTIQTVDFQITVAALTGITAASDKTEYSRGTDFDAAALTVTANYSNGEHKAVQLSAVNVNYSSYNKNTAGAYTITVSYGGYSDTYTVTVTVPYVLELTINSGSNKKFILPIKQDTANDLYIDWGDGEQQHYTGNPTSYRDLTHTYPDTGDYVIKLGGSTYSTYPSGALGFGFTGSGSSGGDFDNDFNSDLNRSKLKVVSGNLVALLGDYNGSNVHMFDSTFWKCTNLTTVSAGLFSGIAGAQYMFYCTFGDCTKLTTIPAGLFSGVSNGSDQSNMFDYTFSDSGLTSIPDGLFFGINGNAYKIFYRTFLGCSNLTGNSAKTSDGRYLYEAYPNNGDDCYSGATGLSDYASIPVVWK
ncbi:bacterial Ig-like domain group 3 [Candidatus Termititenax dinenymphae]|uniref:Bacterial Ig-like domain group 3 n=1 Tax=Candidatus Termititenax dinenymphae TaxID=2218523 RepID=A0A388TK21_9BACT|nr:bacterial Ig-like domain group 3 [Candidatus Termititenax dinenymphae]